VHAVHHVGQALAPVRQLHVLPRVREVLDLDGVVVRAAAPAARHHGAQQPERVVARRGAGRRAYARGRRVGEGAEGLLDPLVRPEVLARLQQVVHEAPRLVACHDAPEAGVLHDALHTLLRVRALHLEQVLEDEVHLLQRRLRGAQ